MIMTQNSIDYTTTHFRDLLKKHGIFDFETLWDLPLQAIDEANTERGGTSNAYRLQLEAKEGEIINYVVKKQEGHLTRNFLKPWQSIPTFEREWLNSLYLEKPVIQFCYFAKRNERAIIMSEELSQYLPLDQILLNQDDSPLSKQQSDQMLYQIANTIASIHQAGYVHKSLYMKHIFVAPQKNFKTVVIDLEKARPYWPVLRITRDLSSLIISILRKNPIRTALCLRFLLYYFGSTKITPQIKRYWKWIEKRINKRAQGNLFCYDAPKSSLKSKS